MRPQASARTSTCRSNVGKLLGFHTIDLKIIIARVLACCVRVCVCLCVRVCVCVRARASCACAYVRVRACACVYSCACVSANAFLSVNVSVDTHSDPQQVYVGIRTNDHARVDVSAGMNEKNTTRLQLVQRIQRRGA